MLAKELMLRTLRANLVPAPRVIVPGPKTSFPLIRVSPDGSHTVVPDLKAAKGILPDGGFFMEMEHVTRVTKVPVSGLCPALDLAVRAAYCLGMDSAVVTVGFGSSGSPGPKVLDVQGTGEPQTRRIDGFAFLGTEVEYLRLDAWSDGPVLSLHKVWFPADELRRDGRLCLPASLAAEAATARDRWVSSPYCSGVPLTTRLIFKGAPIPVFLRCLDRTVALLGMLLSPAEKTRARHATPEGVLGAMRRPAHVSAEYAGDPQGEVFEYLSVPSLFWSPDGLAAIMSLASAVAAHPEYFAEALRLRTPVDLAANFERQKAYYDADKAYFKEEMRVLADLVARLPRSGAEASNLLYRSMEEALRAASGDREISAGDPEDFRSAWGISPDTKAFPRGSGLRLRADASASRIDLAPENSIPGPVFGIMAIEKAASGGRKEKFGIETDRFIRILQMAESMGMLAYVFFPEGDPGEDKVSDYPVSKPLIPVWIHRPWSGWARRMAPLPDVVYDRYIPLANPGRTADDVAARFLGKLPHVKFINSLPFTNACRDKMKTHEILLGDPVLAAHLPETIPVTNVDSAIRFIASHETSFLKPLRGTGSKGLTVFRRCVSTGSEAGDADDLEGYRQGLGCTSPRDLRFEVSQRGLDGRVRDTEVLDLAGVEALLRSMVVPGCERETAYEPRFVLQEGIRMAQLPKGSGSAFEIRVIYQKGGLGKWRRTGMVSRVNPGPEGFIVPGKELHVRVDEVLESVFPGRVSEIKEQIRGLARRVPPLIEASSGYGGEMSIDFGIDHGGRPWFIEVNSKPATLFRDLGAFKLRELSLRRVLNFASFLHAEQVPVFAEFSIPARFAAFNPVSIFREEQ